MTQTALKLWLESIWWIITAVVAYAVLVPVYKAMHVWPFLAWNIIFIAALVTMTRHIFLLPYTFLARKQLLKVAIVFPNHLRLGERREYLPVVRRRKYLGNTHRTFAGRPKTRHRILPLDGDDLFRYRQRDRRARAGSPAVHFHLETTQ